MANIIKEIRLIKLEQTTENNNYKYWIGKLFDDGNVKVEYARVGALNPQTKEYNKGDAYFDKTVKSKLKDGYVEQKTINGSSPASPSAIKSNAELCEIAKKQIIKTPNPILERLIKRLVDSNVHKITSNTQVTYNSTTGLFATPLGILSKSGLIEARDLLASISPLVKSNTLNSEFNKLVFKYLTIVPQNLGMKRILPETVIPNNDALQKQLDLIDSLEASYDALHTNKPTTTVPTEELFKVGIDILTDDRERSRLNDYFEKSKKDMHNYNRVKIREIYKVNIHDMTNSFNHKLSPVHEVFHGTSEANCLSILKSGLKISPPSTATIAGKLWGEGIYGAINSSKSMGYTFGRWGQSASDTGWIYICDFALGNIFYPTTYKGNLKSGHDSVWAKASSTGLHNDEIIVYKNNQVKIKYLLEIK